MKKSKLLILSALSAMALTSCSLFKDDDIVVENHFNTKEEASTVVESDVKAGGVAATTSSDVPGAMVFKNVEYYNSTEGKKILNTYTTDNGFKYDVNKKEDYDADPNNNNFDMYIPEGIDKTKDQNVVLFIHGGAWISGLKSHVNPYVKMFANKGYVSATIEYTLLDADLLDEAKADKELKNSELSVFRDLDEIDACIFTMKKCLKELGFNEDKLHLVIGGASSGAHLAMLYSYSRAATCPMPIKFIVDAVGPTDIKEDVWKTFKAANQEEYDTMLEDGIEYSSINAKKSADKLRALPVSGQDYAWNEYQTMRIANGMCGLPFSLSEVEAAAADEKKETVNHSKPVYESIVSDTESGQDLLSVTHYLKTSAKIPMLCAYSGKDNVVGIGQFANLQYAMEHDAGYVKGTDYEYFFFKECGHVNLDTDKTQYEAFTNKIVNWLETK